MIETLNDSGNKLLLFLSIVLFLSCEKSIQIDSNQIHSKFFITAEINRNESKSLPIQITVDYFNNSQQNSKFDTNELKLYLSDINGIIALKKQFTISNTGLGNYTLYYTNLNPYDCISGSYYKLKCVYKNDSFEVEDYLHDTIGGVVPVFIYNSPTVIQTYHKILDSDMSNVSYDYMQKSSSGYNREYKFQNVFDSNTLLPNEAYSGCVLKMSNNIIRSNLLKTSRKTAKMLNQIAQNFYNNEFNNNPFYLPYTPDFNINNKFAYGYLACIQQKAIGPDTIKDISNRIINFKILDKNQNPLNLNLIDIQEFEFKSNSTAKKNLRLEFDQSLIYFTENNARVLAGYNDCQNPTYSEQKVSVKVTYIQNGIEKSTELLDFNVVGDKGKTLELIEK